MSIVENRKAFHDYFIEERLEAAVAGIAETGLCVAQGGRPVDGAGRHMATVHQWHGPVMVPAEIGQPLDQGRLEQWRVARHDEDELGLNLVQRVKHRGQRSFVLAGVPADPHAWGDGLA